MFAAASRLKIDVGYFPDDGLDFHNQRNEADGEFGSPTAKDYSFAFSGFLQPLLFQANLQF